jgi:uncharacterized repeat protein (TIGR01451 family)
MTGHLRILSAVVLLALVFTISSAGAAEPEALKADLNVSKAVSSTGPYEINDTVTWAVTLHNAGPANATSITLQEDMSRLTGLRNVTVTADRGIYNSSTNIWSIDRLNNASSATLTIKTNFTSAGLKTNRIRITGMNETDPVSGNNQAEAVVQFNTSGNNKTVNPVYAKLEIRPTTLNLNSKGVFTVYVTLTGFGFTPDEGSRKPRLDFANSSLTCGEADMIRASVSGKNGGTLIAKFHRYDLENVTAGNGVLINCSGTLVVDDTIVTLEGNDTVRVVGEKKGLDKILSRLWKFLGIEKDDIEINETEDGNITVMFTLDPDNFKNNGQAKKFLKNQEKESRGERVNETGISEQTQSGKENKVKNNEDNKQGNQIRKNNSEDDQNNNGSGKRNDDAPGKSNGKKNK